MKGVIASLGALAALSSTWVVTADRAPDAEPPALTTEFSLLALGDTGRYQRELAWFDPQLAVARGLEAEDRRDPIDLLLLLGDNFYLDGLDAVELEDQIRLNLVRPYCRFASLSGLLSDRVADACELKDADRHRVPFVAVLGNHDYGSQESPRLEREAVPLYVDNWRASSGLVETLAVAPGVSLILLDSELIVEERADLTPLTKALDAAPGPWRVLVVHRPIAEVDRRFAKQVHKAIRAARHAPQLVLSGHDHNLQAWEMEDLGSLQLVAGSGAHTKDVKGEGQLFARKALGFLRLDLTSAEDSGERFVASFYTTPWYAWLFSTPTLVARFSVDRAGRTKREPTERAVAQRPERAR